MFKLALQSIITRHLKQKLLKQTITLEEIDPILKEIRTSFLNADVNLIVLKQFINKIKEKALVNATLPIKTKIDQYLWQLIHTELIELFGKQSQPINISSTPPTKILLVGLNGAGKTTTAAKLAYHFQKKSLETKLVALDHYRPAAIEQLEQLAKKIKTPFFAAPTETTVSATKLALKWIHESKTDLVIFDTAGRMQTNTELMKELVAFKKLIQPQEIIFVADAMSGQEILSVAQEFHQHLNLTGIIMTKADSDARMGAVISLVSILKVSIKYFGEGEKVEDLSNFYPERFANRIIGAGDLETLSEKALAVTDEQLQKKTLLRMINGQFDLEDLLQQMKQINKMGSLSKILNFIPNANLITANVGNIETMLKKWEIILNSMTRLERRNPRLFKKQLNRRHRVIKGSGCATDDFNKLLKKWEESIKKFASFAQQIKKGKNPFPFF